MENQEFLKLLKAAHKDFEQYKLLPFGVYITRMDDTEFAPHIADNV